MSNDDFSLDDNLDDSKTIEFIQGYLPSELKEKFTEDQLYYFLDLIANYFINNGVLDNVDSNGDVEIDINIYEIVSYIVKESKKNKKGEFDPEDIFFIVQGELEYGASLGMVD